MPRTSLHRRLLDVPNLVRSAGYRSIYRGKVKLVHRSHRSSTGQAFEHYDDWMEHSTWLSFMRERLLLIRELLRPGRLGLGPPGRCRAPPDAATHG